MGYIQDYIGDYTIRVIEGDMRSLDHGSREVQLAKGCVTRGDEPKLAEAQFENPFAMS